MSEIFCLQKKYFIRYTQLSFALHQNHTYEFPYAIKENRTTSSRDILSFQLISVPLQPKYLHPQLYFVKSVIESNKWNVNI